MPLKLRHFVDYHQPDFYHFSQDSIEFIHWIEKQNLFGVSDQSFSCLDLCAGCGVIGLELLNIYPQINMDFCELQENFEKYFIKNRQQLFLKEFVGNYFVTDFKKLYQGPYDFIFSNPPYFSPLQGRLSPSLERRICRFFLPQDWQDLFASFERLLKPTGLAFFLAREEKWEKNVFIKQVGSLSGASIFCFDLNIKRNE